MKYQIKDLRGVIRVGDEIKFEIGEFKEERKEKVIDISPTDFITQDDHKNLCFYPFSSSLEVELIQNPITWETLREGDEIKFVGSLYKPLEWPKVGEVIKVIGRSGQVIFMDFNIPNHSAANTIKRLEENGYVIVQPENITNPEEEVLEMTVKDVEKLVGKKVKIVKEK